METKKKKIAIVHHPGFAAEAVVSRLGALSAEFVWQPQPAVHMLGRNTPDEETVYDYLLGRTEQGKKHHPDGVVVLVSATGLERQLYLASQVIDLRLPTVIALTDLEVAAQKGLTVNPPKMAEHIGIAVQPLQSHPGKSAEVLVETVSDAFANKEPKKMIHWRPPIALADAYNHLDNGWIYKHIRLHKGARLLEGLRLISVPKAIDDFSELPEHEALVQHLEEAREIISTRKENWALTEVLQRNNFISQLVATATQRVEVAPDGGFWTRIIDRMRPGVN